MVVSYLLLIDFGQCLVKMGLNQLTALLEISQDGVYEQETLHY